MATVSTFGFALHVPIVHQCKLGFRRTMTAGDLLLMVAMTMIDQHLSPEYFTETGKLISHDFKYFHLKLICLSFP